MPQVPAGQAFHSPLSCSIDHTGFDRTSFCTGYHALQHKCKSNRVAGRQDKRLQHVRPDPAPHQIRHEAHQLEECKKGYRPEVRLISTEPELKICRLQVGGDDVVDDVVDDVKDDHGDKKIILLPTPGLMLTLKKFKFWVRRMCKQQWWFWLVELTYIYINIITIIFIINIDIMNILTTISVRLSYWSS